MQVLLDVAPSLAQGALVTLQIALAAGLIAVIVAVAVGVLREVGGRVANAALGVYVEFFRGTSAFVQIFWAYFALPMVGIRMSAMTAGILILGFNVGAYGSEVVRGALRAVPAGQREACMALGLPTWVTYSHVMLPQAMLRSVLPMGNLLVDLLKGTALVSAITVTELAFSARQAVFVHGHALTIFGAVLFIYLLMAAPVAWGARVLDDRLRLRYVPGGRP